MDHCFDGRILFSSNGIEAPAASVTRPGGETPVVENADFLYMLQDWSLSGQTLSLRRRRSLSVLYDNPYDRSSRRSDIRVLLVDDHARVRAALRSLLESYPNLSLVGEASNGEEAVRLVRELSPSVVVMDINMPKLNGIDATLRIKMSYPHVVIVGLSVSATDAHRQAMTAAGATTLISKSMAVEQLYVEIQTAINGRSTASH
jgi:CheY-like chemotaxis protein